MSSAAILLGVLRADTINYLSQIVYITLVSLYSSVMRLGKSYNLIQLALWTIRHTAELQISGGIEDNSKIIFLISQQKRVVTPH